MTVFSIEDELPETTLCGLLIEGAIGRLELQRADRYNALDVQLISEIIQLLDWSAERSVGQRGDLTDANGARYLRVLIVSGHGKHFCAGADINMMRDAGLARWPRTGSTPNASTDCSTRSGRTLASPSAAYRGSRSAAAPD